MTWGFNKATGKEKRATGAEFIPATGKGTESETDDVDSDTPGSGSVTPSYDSEKPDSTMPINLKAGRAATTMAGGKRRKAVRRR
jgi:hypothetical protein